jgi:hypothetical protein
MPYQRKYDFKPNTRASSSQMDEELNQLIGAVNTLENSKETPAGALLQIQNYLPPQTSLWAGAAYMVASSTVTPTKKLSQCKHGWILVWSDYDPGVGANDYDFIYSYIPKYAGVLNGKSHLFPLPISLSSTAYASTGKRLYIYDDKLVGHDDNSASGSNTNDVCLRAVLEW